MSTTRHRDGQPSLISVPDAARSLGVSVRTVWRLAKKGHLRIVRLRRRSLVSVASIEALIERGGDR
jgi:excisionase family DNA binding protein